MRGSEVIKCMMMNMVFGKAPRTLANQHVLLSLEFCQGTNKSVEAKSPTSVHSSSISNDPHSTMLMLRRSRSCQAETVEAVKENPKMKHVASSGATGIVSNVVSDMPCVFTKGDGPNGKRIDGFLYGYRKGEQVRIVCVCHGSFFTPAEFVKHAGGGEVENPLRQIVVNPSPLLS